MIVNVTAFPGYYVTFIRFIVSFADQNTQSIEQDIERREREAVCLLHTACYGTLTR